MQIGQPVRNVASDDIYALYISTLSMLRWVQLLPNFVTLEDLDGVLVIAGFFLVFSGL